LAYRFHIFLFDSKLDSLYATAGARLCTSASTGFPSMLRKSGRREQHPKDGWPRSKVFMLGGRAVAGESAGKRAGTVRAADE